MMMHVQPPLGGRNNDRKSSDVTNWTYIFIHHQKAQKSAKINVFVTRRVPLAKKGPSTASSTAKFQILTKLYS